MSKARQQQGEMGEGMIFTLIQDRYWSSLEGYCGEYGRRTGDPVYTFWRAFALFNLGSANEAINELLPIQQKKEISYAVIAALLIYQGRAKNIDRDEIDALRGREREERKNGADKAIIQAVYFFLFSGEPRKAGDLLEEKDNGSALYQMARLWYRLLDPELEQKEQLEQEVDRAYEEKDKNVPRILIFLARNAVKLLLKKFGEALETLNEGIVFYPTFLPFVSEKYTCLMALGEWDEFQQAALEVSQRDTFNIQAVRALAFYELAQVGSIDNAFMRIKELESVIERREDRNAQLLFECAHLFLRICGKNRRIVELVQGMINKCRRLQPLNADFAVEQGHQHLMLGQVSEAYKCYQEASSLDESKLESITGMIECKLLEEEIDDAEHQLQFVNVMQQTVGRTPYIAYLEAMLTIRKPNQTNQSLTDFYAVLEGALKLQIAYSKTLAHGFSYYSKLNPAFLFNIAELYLQPVSMKDMIAGSESAAVSGPISKGIKLLETITRQISGYLPAYLLLAKGKLAVGNELDASLAIGKVLSMDSRNEEGSILSAMIKKKRKEFEAALSSLQEAISINFRIRENPLFMLIKGEIEYEMRNYAAAEETMQQAAQLPPVKRKLVLERSKEFKILTFSEKDRCSVYLLLAKCLIKNKKVKESKAVMMQAIAQFSGTAEEVYVMLANAEIAVETADIKKAMSILRQVSPDSTYFVESRKLLADVHLIYLKSRKGYARCYYEIIEKNPIFQNFKTYGDALIRINEPEEAAVAYQKAYQEKPDNQQIIRDLGRAYTLAHDYEKAVKFYEDNIEKLNRPDLILDLARLCIQLKRYERAEALLMNEAFSEETGSHERLKQNVAANMYLHSMELKKQGPFDTSPSEKARKYIKNAIKLEKAVIEKLRLEGGAADDEKVAYANLYYEIAKYAYDYEKNIETTRVMLEQCLSINEEHERALQMIAELSLKQGKADKAQEYCGVLLKVNPNNDQAGSILAELLLKSNQYEGAIIHFKRMLGERPDNYPVLAKLIDFFRRSNALPEAKAYIENAQNKANNTNDSGLCYCRGLYHKYARSPAEALIEFNKAKKSTQYAQNSLTHMIDIFLCPEQDLYFSALEGRAKSVHPENIRICESLLREMQTRATKHRFIVMEAYVTMLKGSYKSLDDVIRRLLDLLTAVLMFQTQGFDYPPAMHALAIAKFLTKKDAEASNFLKQCSKTPYQPEFGEELEKAWLLHAESYIQIKKFDNAEELLKMLVKENQSCGKAEELMGLIRQKQQAYTDAADFYKRAFELTSSKSAPIGYRLAFNYMKAKRYVECLEVCRQVMEKQPNYAPIQTDIANKVIEILR